MKRGILAELLTKSHCNFMLQERIINPVPTQHPLLKVEVMKCINIF
jgi:hypothetical protein